MKKGIKITYSELTNPNTINRICKFKNEMIDLSELNIFEAAKTIIMISSYNSAKNLKKNFKYKVSTPHIKSLLNEITLNSNFELV